MKILHLLLLLLIIETKIYGEEKIIALKSGSNPVYDSALNSFIKYCNCSVESYDLISLGNIPPHVIEKIKNQKSSFLIAVGTGALKTVSAQFPEKKVLYLIGINPELVGIPSENVFGISVFIDSREVAEIIKDILTNVKTVACLISPKLKKVGDELGNSLSEKGLKFLLITANDPVEGFQKISEPEFDLLYLLPDPDVLNSVSYQAIVKLSEKKNFLVVAPSSTFLRIGGHISFEPDLERAGSEAVKMIEDIRGGKKGKMIPLSVKSILLKKEMAEGIKSKKYKIEITKGGEQ